jgi:hypothetical protein
MGKWAGLLEQDRPTENSANHNGYYAWYAMPFLSVILSVLRQPGNLIDTEQMVYL